MSMLLRLAAALSFMRVGAPLIPRRHHSIANDYADLLVSHLNEAQVQALSTMSEVTDGPLVVIQRFSRPSWMEPHSRLEVCARVHVLESPSDTFKLELVQGVGRALGPSQFYSKLDLPLLVRDITILVRPPQQAA